MMPLNWQCMHPRFDVRTFVQAHEVSNPPSPIFGENIRQVYRVEEEAKERRLRADGRRAGLSTRKACSASSGRPLRCAPASAVATWRLGFMQAPTRGLPRLGLGVETHDELL